MKTSHGVMRRVLRVVLAAGGLAVLGLRLSVAAPQDAVQNQEPATPAPTKPLAIRLGRLVDGKGQVWNDAVVIVQGERIVRVSTGEAAVPAEAEVIDLRRFTGIPGRVNSF